MRDEAAVASVPTIEARGVRKSFGPLRVLRDVSLAIPRGAAVAIGSEPDDRKIRGAAADVGDQRQLLAGDAALVVQRGRDRLELERHLLEADRKRDLAQRLLRAGVAVRIAVDEMDRAAMHYGLERAAGRGLRAALHDGVVRHSPRRRRERDAQDLATARENDL